MGIKERIVKLLEVKSIVTISLTIVLCVETVRGNVEIDAFMTIYLMIAAFYFGTQSKKKEGNE